MNRRDVLKLFGVGGIVVPIVGGMPMEEARSLIVTPPEIEVPTAGTSTPMLPDFDSPYETVMYCRSREGRCFRIVCETFVTEHEWAPPFYQIIDSIESRVPGIRATTKFVVTGKISFRDC